MNFLYLRFTQTEGRAFGSRPATQDHAGLLGRADELDPRLLEGALKIHKRLRAAGRNTVMLFQPLDGEPVRSRPIRQIGRRPAEKSARRSNL